jgi:tellurite resistance protein TehA-like permease
MKNKSTAVWLTLILGLTGLHRLYLFKRFDAISWMLLLPTLIGAYGLLRAHQIGLEDHLSWLLIPWIGLSAAASSLMAIVYGLMETEKWNVRYNPGSPSEGAPGTSGWLTIVGVVIALMLGATALLSSLAFSLQRYFEYQALDAPVTAAAINPRKSAN